MLKLDWKFFSVSSVFFSFIYLYISLNLMSDISAHALVSDQILKGEIAYPGNFILYFLVNLFCFFQSGTLLTQVVLCSLVGIATSYRLNLAINYIKYENQKNLSSVLFYLIALSLICVFSISIQTLKLSSCFYFGYYVPNVWHNSTVLFLFPFAIILFYLSTLQIENYDKRRNIIMTFLIFLNVFIKPSFFFVFAITYPMFLFYKYRFSTKFFYSIIPVLFGGVLLLVEIYVIYLSKYNIDNSSIEYGFFIPYNSFKIFPFKMVLSILFPILYLILNKNKSQQKQVRNYLIVSWIVSLLVFFFFRETGVRAYDWNFYWQIIIYSWLLFLFTLTMLITDILEFGFTFKNIFLSAIYFIHVIFGFIYLVRYYIYNIYS